MSVATKKIKIKECDQVKIAEHLIGTVLGKHLQNCLGWDFYTLTGNVIKRSGNRVLVNFGDKDNYWFDSDVIDIQKKILFVVNVKQ